jgi:hypothetical protein
MNITQLDQQMEYSPQSDERIAKFTKIATSVGARIHVLRRVCIQQDRDWQESINLAASNTPPNFDVRRPEISIQHQPVSKKIVEKDIVLLNYPNGDHRLDKASRWAQKTSLKPTNPREVFAIGEQYPTLHKTLGQNLMYVVAPMECSFGGDSCMCYVWWGGSDRRVSLSWINYLDYAGVWFAFSE